MFTRHIRRGLRSPQILFTWDIINYIIHILDCNARKENKNDNTTILAPHLPTLPTIVFLSHTCHEKVGVLPIKDVFSI